MAPSTRTPSYQPSFDSTTRCVKIILLSLSAAAMMDSSWHKFYSKAMLTSG